MRKKLVSAVVMLGIAGSLLLSACAYKDAKIPTDVSFVYNEADWETTFFDDFNGDVIDAEKWHIDNLINTKNPEQNGIRRAGYYVDDRDIVYVKDGNLTIATKHKNGKYGEGWYTGWLDTRTTPRIDAPAFNQDYKGFSQTQGYFEIRCKAPPIKGVWSAFWLMPDEGVAFSDKDVQWSGADGVEIDIMESPSFAAGRSNNTHVVHGDGYKDTLKSDKSPTYAVDDMYNTFHTYSVEWTAEKYIFYIDGYKTWETPFQYDGRTLGVSTVSQFLILSVEVGGVNENGVMYPGKTRNNNGKWENFWAGNPEDNDKTKSYDFVVDYVKVMRKK